MTVNTQWRHWTSEFRGERPTADSRRLEIWGYSGKPSYAPTEELTLHVSTTAERFAITIYRDGAAQELVYQTSGHLGIWYETPLDAYERGCGWPACISIPIPTTWRTGGYVVEFTTDDTRGSVTQHGFFVVRPVAGKESSLALVLATYTWQEYNDWGGGSGYSLDPVPGRESSGANGLEGQKTIGGFSPRLSFDRPWARGFIRLPVGAPRAAMRQKPPAGWATRYEQAEWAYANGYSMWSGMAGWARYDALFVRWAERNGYQVDMLTQWDLDQASGLLNPYRCVITVGHDEYWTANGRDQLERFIQDGGNYARLAGNIFWQIRLENGGKTQVCYKYAPEADPLFDNADARMLTGAWESAHINRPAVTTFGANGTRGAYTRFGGGAPRGPGGFIVYRNNHPIFAGTDLYYGDIFGETVPLVGYEVDGVSYTFTDGLPFPTGADGAPKELEILALTPATFEEEDHGGWGSVLIVRDGDLGFVARSIFGSDTPEHRDKVRRGAAVMTWMRKHAGEVFCGGSTEWPFALAESDPTVERIVRNVLDRFAQGCIASTSLGRP